MIADDGTVYIGSSSDTGSQWYGFLHAFGIGELQAIANGPYYGLTNMPVQFTGASTGGYQPHSYHWDFGDTHSSDEQNPTHVYSENGNYTVTLTVTDNNGSVAVNSTFAWIQDSNSPPGMPVIDGPVNGNIEISYDYTFSAVDPEGTLVWYYVDWGDDLNTGWFGPYGSGEQITRSHTWNFRGIYTIRCKARDPYGDEGPWGELVVRMPRVRIVNSWLLWFLEQFPILSRLLSSLILIH